MNFTPAEPLKNRTPFHDAISHGSTLLFVQSDGEQMRAEYAAAKLGLTCASTRWMGQESALQSFAMLPAAEHPNRILIARAPQMAHGARVRVDRVIWVGDLGEIGTQKRALTVQSLSRGPINCATHSFEGVPAHD